jgi:hypothetical protein
MRCWRGGDGQERGRAGGGIARWSRAMAVDVDAAAGDNDNRNGRRLQKTTIGRRRRRLRPAGGDGRVVDDMAGMGLIAGILPGTLPTYSIFLVLYQQYSTRNFFLVEVMCEGSSIL